MTLSKMTHHTRPVNRDTARVAFFRGEHFTAPKRESAQRIHTWRYPPIVIGTPDNYEPSWAGHKNGYMTALYWFRPGKRGKPAVWIVRCNCGSYEARVPARWNEFLEKRWRDADRCEACKDTAVSTSAISERQTKHSPTRRNRWIASMLALGLSVEEVAAVMQSDIRTAGCTASQIRAALREAAR